MVPGQRMERDCYFLFWDCYFLQCRITTRCQSVSEQTCAEAGSRATSSPRSPCTHLLAVLGRVHPVVQTGLVRQPEGLLEHVLGPVLEGQSEDKVAQPSVLFLAVVAEVDEVLDVVVATNVLELLSKAEGEDC